MNSSLLLYCYRCKRELPETDFCRDKSHPNRRSRFYLCRTCEKAKFDAYYAQHRDEIIDRVMENQAGIPHDDRRHTLSLLTRKILRVLEVNEEHEKGWNHRQIARALGCTRQAVQRVKRLHFRKENNDDCNNDPET